jgi:hypothetical protein
MTQYKEITAMARVCDFEQFSDVSVDLRIGGDIDRTFTSSLDSTPASGEGSLLKWMVRREGTGCVTYEVRVNSVLVCTHTVTLADWSAVQEALATDQIHFGSNSVEFRVTAGTGTLSIGDVMLFYRQDT